MSDLCYDSYSAVSVIQVDFMRLRLLTRTLLAFLLVPAGCSFFFGQSPMVTPGQSLQRRFDSINHKVLEMAKDFPEDKYGFRLKPEMRSFGELIVHIASGNVYASKAGRGEQVNWNDLDPKEYKTKAAIVALMQKSLTDADATLKSLPNDAFAKSVEPWLDVTEHTAEHYGLLVAYYRANGLVPPASRPNNGSGAGVSPATNIAPALFRLPSPIVPNKFFTPVPLVGPPGGPSTTTL